MNEFVAGGGLRIYSMIPLTPEPQLERKFRRSIDQMSFRVHSTSLRLVLTVSGVSVFSTLRCEELWSWSLFFRGQSTLYEVARFIGAPISV